MKKINLQKNKFLISLAAGALGSLAFAPLHIFILAPIALSVFYFLLDGAAKRKEIFWLGFAFGFGHFLVGIYWIAISLLVDAASFAWLIPFALTLIPSALALYLALFALLYKFCVSKFKLNFSYQKILTFALLWVIFEILRSLLFTGFPWNLLGYIWMFDEHFAQSASIFGIYGLSFFAVLICLLPTLFFDKKPNKIFATILVTLFVTNAVYGYLRVDDSKIVTNPKTKLRLVQGNIKQEMKWDAQEKYKNLLKHIELTNSKSLDDISAVIWSETAVPYVIEEGSELLAKLRQATPPEGVLITGALRLGYFDESKTQISNAWNSVFTLNQSGISNTYDKHHLVPFGEYIPLQNYVPFVEKITEGAMGFSEGEGAQTLAAQGFSFSPLICYEVIFSDEILNKNSRPDLFVNVTNDAWFGKSSGPYQHFDMSKMRAIEYAIPMARVANTGITAFIDPFGRVINKINLNQSGFIDVNLVSSLAPTIYEKYKYIPLVLLFVATVLLLIILPKSSNVVRQNHANRRAHRGKTS
ncbi:MAG: apolipoprotein N-acyltransferase [Rickettsiales bacterium]|nr:apolipoprotein N-acyltransferase [Rickettsiales bacterium]